MRNASHFQPFSGCYLCRCCKRNTRSTGRGDNENVQLCAECFDLGGIENEILDEGSTPEREAEAEALRVIIRSKGGIMLEYPGKCKKCGQSWGDHQTDYSIANYHPKACQFIPLDGEKGGKVS